MGLEKLVQGAEDNRDEGVVVALELVDEAVVFEVAMLASIDFSLGVNIDSVPGDQHSSVPDRGSLA